MKKNVKKLLLAKETLRDLVEPRLREAAGGESYTCWSECDCLSIWISC